MRFQHHLNLLLHGYAKFRRHELLHVFFILECLILVNLQSYARISQVFHVNRKHCIWRLLAVVFLSLLRGFIRVSFAIPLCIVLIKRVFVDVVLFEMVDDFGLHHITVI